MRPTNTPSSTRNPHARNINFAIHFSERNHPGYLLIKRLAAGVFGTTMLVLSLDDQKIYVRKIEKIPTERTADAIQSSEVRFYTPHPNIPRLISYKDYDFPPLQLAANGRVKTATIWQFCNGGSLDPIVAELYQASGALLASGSARSSTPQQQQSLKLQERIIYHFFSSILSTLMQLHTRGIAHNDVHEGNIFLHWATPDTNLPDFFLGDFGNAMNYPASTRSHPDRRINTPWLIGDLSQLEPRSQPTRSNTTTRRPGGSGIARSHSLHVTNPSTLNPHPIDVAATRQFYHATRRDHERTFQLIQDLSLIFRRNNNNNQQISNTLQNLTQRYGTILDSAYHTMRPAHFMQSLRELLAAVKLAQRDLARLSPSPPSQSTTMTTTRNVSGSQLPRPALPAPTPALWRDPRTVGVRHGREIEVLMPVTMATVEQAMRDVRLEQERRDEVRLWLDVGTFRVVRVEQRNGWVVVDDDDDDDDDSEDEN